MSCNKVFPVPAVGTRMSLGRLAGGCGRVVEDHPAAGEVGSTAGSPGCRTAIAAGRVDRLVERISLGPVTAPLTGLTRGRPAVFVRRCVAESRPVRGAGQARRLIGACRRRGPHSLQLHHTKSSLEPRGSHHYTAYCCEYDSNKVGHGVVIRGRRRPPRGTTERSGMPPVSEHGLEIAELYVETDGPYAINADLIQAWSGDELVDEVAAEPDSGGWVYRYRSMSAGMATALGRPSSELIGRRLDEVLSPAVALRTLQRLDRVIEAGVSSRVLQDADIADRRASVETTSTPVRHEDGSLSVVTVIRDVTHSVVLARSAVHGREMLQRVFAISPDMIALVGPDGTIHYANAAFARVLGLDPVTLVGTRLTALLDAPGGALLDDLAGLEPGELVPARIRTSHDSWRDVDVTVSGTPDSDPSSQDNDAVVVIRDMTAARRN